MTNWMLPTKAEMASLARSRGEGWRVNSCSSWAMASMLRWVTPGTLSLAWEMGSGTDEPPLLSLAHGAIGVPPLHPERGGSPRAPARGLRWHFDRADPPA